MLLNSSIYTAKVMHHRLAPKKHSFWYNIYICSISIWMKSIFCIKNCAGLATINLTSFLFAIKNIYNCQKKIPIKLKYTRAQVEDYLKEEWC